ncbi:hypothetical protein [Terriglobus saanensis]|uniref:Adenylate cyclase n=1 Tax=Terriglobus saanensis (strain ATCC BAA-1853 / DSM 23119 / SP1PR4) TaxID=401053 RepID=E8UYP9_TERSS|nr:hypothetical protein [Terriglobus saanensis]ADV83202.1 hypothetical protein AciPR4_2422 [Terriglobus saanensis SP1PR4]
MNAGDIHGEEIHVFSAGDRKRVHAALHELMASPPLRTTLQCQHLLQYIVNHTLTGEDALLRERVIGKEVFGRKPDYEPGEDPVVRIRAADLRKRLALYYQSIHTVPEVRIDVPSGSYRAVFTWKTEDAGVESHPHFVSLEDPAVVPSPESSTEVGQASLEISEPLTGAPVLPLPLIPAASPDPSFRGGSRWPWIVVLVLLIAGTFTGVNWYRGRADRMLRTFWTPVLDSSKPVLISIGSNAVYRVSDDKADEYSRQNHIENSGMEFFPKFDPGQSFASTGLYPAGDSFVALGDVASVAETVSMLAHFTKTFQERFPNDISFAEVRNNPTVLIGGFNNPMTRELTRNFRFVLASRNRIEDRNQPGKAWVLHASSDSHDTEDYAIVTRVLRHEEDEPLVSVAGMGQYGTLAATNFVCKPESLQQLGANLGKDWQRHNFQIVLRIKIIDFKPVSTSIIATHTW